MKREALFLRLQPARSGCGVNLIAGKRTVPAFRQLEFTAHSAKCRAVFTAGRHNLGNWFSVTYDDDLFTAVDQSGEVRFGFVNTYFQALSF